MIFPARTDHAFSGERSLSSLKNRTAAWVRRRWDGELRYRVLEMIKFDHLSATSIDMYFLEAAFVILRNIIQNAVKHGEPASDRLFVDDRPWFGSRRTPCLRIFYRSSRAAPPYVTANLGIAPSQEAKGLRVGYGMYNVGLLTRLLGGSLYVTPQHGNSRLTVEVHLPFPE